ncbi:MAG: GAF domain-containing protein, partial [Actinomycetota bacterium]
MVVAVVTVAIGVMSLNRELLSSQFVLDDLSSWVVVVLLSGLAVAFLIYVIEKEGNLRRLTTALVEERVRSAALSARLTDTASLLEVGKAVNSTLNLEDVLRMILSSALQLLEAGEGSVMLLDESGENLEVVSYHGLRGHVVMNKKTRIGEGVSGRVAETREPVLISNNSSVDGVQVDPSRGITSGMCVPLVRRDELMGVLNVNQLIPGKTFGGDALAALEVFAEQAAIAIGNARSFAHERETVVQLEELDRLKSDFVATVSHELKTPLTAIIAAAKTVSRRGAQLERDQELVFMEMIERQGARLLRLVEDVLTASKIESGLPMLQRELVDLEVIAGQIAADAAHTKEGAGRAIEVVVTEGGANAWVDRVAIEQILSNLIENAVKYSEPSTPIGVRLDVKPAEAVIEVTDSGRGIAEEQLATIFERFRQADSSL